MAKAGILKDGRQVSSSLYADTNPVHKKSNFDYYKQSSNFKKETSISSKSKEAALTLSKSARELLKKKQSHVVRYFDATAVATDNLEVSPKVLPK
jgi:hypothetical protein